MKNIIIIFFSSLTLATFGQFPSAHLDLLSKINVGLTDSWTPDIETDSSFNSEINIPAIKIDLFNYKSEEGNENRGVGIYLFEKKYSSTVNSYDWAKADDSAFKIVETKSYFIVIDWFKDYNDIYDSIVQRLIPELTDFFIRNKEKL